MVEVVAVGTDPKQTPRPDLAPDPLERSGDSAGPRVDHRLLRCKLARGRHRHAARDGRDDDPNERKRHDILQRLASAEILRKLTALALVWLDRTRTAASTACQDT